MHYSDRIPFAPGTVNERPDHLNAEHTRAERFDLISRIVDDVAHELKNPFNSIVINLEVLRSRVRAGEMDAALGRAEVIDAELRRLYALLEAMLRLLRPDRAPNGAVPLGDVLDEVAALAHAQARVARRELVIETIPEDMIVRVRRDALRFALLRIIQAALQGMRGPDAGLRLAAARRADAIALRIEAEGIRADQLDHIPGLAALLEEAGVVETECRDGAAGTACTLLLAQAAELA